MRELLRTIARRSLVPSSRKTFSVVSRVHTRFARFKMVMSFLRLKSGFPRLRTDCLPYAHRGCEQVIRRGPRPHLGARKRPRPEGPRPVVYELGVRGRLYERAPSARRLWWRFRQRRSGASGKTTHPPSAPPSATLPAMPSSVTSGPGIVSEAAQGRSGGPGPPREGAFSWVLCSRSGGPTGRALGSWTGA